MTQFKGEIICLEALVHIFLTKEQVQLTRPHYIIFSKRTTIGLLWNGLNITHI
jgi:hypothetical protein